VLVLAVLVDETDPTELTLTETPLAEELGAEVAPADEAEVPVVVVAGAVGSDGVGPEVAGLALVPVVVVGVLAAVAESTKALFAPVPAEHAKQARSAAIAAHARGADFDIYPPDKGNGGLRLNA
jgi:D-alanine-D-alanine ligase-like ATP-grasp enzyme